MNVDNSLSREFILNYPSEAARVLQQVSVEHVAALFNELPIEQVVSVLIMMLPRNAAACIDVMPVTKVTRLINEMHASNAARLYRFLSPAYQEYLSRSLSEKKRRLLQRYLMYPPSSAGVLADSDIDMLSENMTVSEATRHLKRFDHPVQFAIYIINDKHQLVGIVDPGKLLMSDLHARLKDIMVRKVVSISAHVNHETLLQHPGWRNHRRLPVVERDNALIGTLAYTRLQEAAGYLNARTDINPVNGFLSLAGLYWLSLAQFLDSILSIRSDKGGRR